MYSDNCRGSRICHHNEPYHDMWSYKLSNCRLQYPSPDDVVSMPTQSNRCNSSPLELCLEVLHHWSKWRALFPLQQLQYTPPARWDWASTQRTAHYQCPTQLPADKSPAAAFPHSACTHSLKSILQISTCCTRTLNIWKKNITTNGRVEWSECIYSFQSAFSWYSSIASAVLMSSWKS